MLIDDNRSMCVNTVYFLPSELLGPAVTLNSPVSWWYSWRKAQHGKDEALRYFTDYVEAFPVANLKAHEGDVLEPLVASLKDRVALVQERASEMRDWLRHTRGLQELPMALRNAPTLDVVGFVAAVVDAIPRRQKLSAADIADLKREHAMTIEPARQARAEIFALERKLSDLVNAAYSLTPEDIALMWRTAPPRMPFSPAGPQDVAPPAEDADDQETE